MKKKKSIPFFLVVAILFLILIDSCTDKENPVAPSDEPYQYDSARYNWKVDTLYGQGFYAGLWAKDTNDIFITNVFNNRLYRIQNGIKSFIQYPEDTFLGAVTGDELNNGYIVALKLVDSLYQPVFQYYNGNTFVEIPNPQNLEKNFFFNAVFIKNKNEMWIGSDGYESGFIVKFDGINLTSYPLEDSRTKTLKFFYDENNNLKLLASIHHLDTDKTEFVIYEFTGSQWIKIYSDLNSMRPLNYNILNKYVSAVNEYSIFELVDSSLIPRIVLNPIGSNFSMGGYSFNNIIFPSPIRIQNRVSSLFHWNGGKWSLELSGYFTDPLTEVFMINEDFYCVVSYDQNARTYLMQGRKILF